MVSWVVADGGGSGYGLNHLPYGVFSASPGAQRLGVRIGDMVFDLGSAHEAGLLPEECAAPSLNPLLAAGRTRWAEVRAILTELLGDETHRDAVAPMLVPVDDVALHLPFQPGDWVDFYSSEQHARNIGALFRPDAPDIMPNWRHMPIGYHGRAGTVVVSGTPVRRPHGQRLQDGAVVFGPSARLDIELEMGFVVGPASELGRPVPITAAADYIFGMCLVNDWSARDIQAWEYQPLGPFLGKSFATSTAAWVTPLAALEPFRVQQPPQQPEPLPYLRSDEPWGFDIDLTVSLQSEAMRAIGVEPESIAATNFRHMYWTAAQQLAHLTVSGAALRTGDFFGSGTISGSERGEYGSLLELSWGGTEPIELPDGSTRTFLENGDEVTLGGSAGRGDDRLELGDVAGRIVG